MKNDRNRLASVASHAALVTALALGLGHGFAPQMASAQEADKQESGADAVVVNLKDGKQATRKGEIVEETAAKVTLKAGDGKTTAIKRDEIAKIEYGGEPVGLRKAELSIGRSDFEGAARECKRVADEIDAGKGRAIWKPRALLKAGGAFVQAGQFEAAAEAYQAAAKSMPTSIWVREAYREGVRAWIRAKNAGKALAMAKEAPAAYKGAEYPDEAQDEAKLLSAEALEANGQTADARSIYNVLTNSKDLKVRGRAMLGAAKMAYAAKDTARAEAQFRAIMEDPNVERSVRCGAARWYGEALLAKPGTDKDYVKLRGVASAFSSATAVHSPARGEATDDREAALHQGAIVYDMLAELSKDPKDARAKELWQATAKQWREELVKLYKTSPYAAENTKKLAQAGGAADAPK